MTPKVITCPVCGIEASRAYIDGKPSLDVEAGAFETRCVEPSLAEEPFHCPHVLSAAMDAGVVGRDGWWVGWPRDASEGASA